MKDAATSVVRVGLASIFFELRGEIERIVRRRIGSGDVSADLVQDMYMKCHRSHVDFPDREQARAYLLRMASNLAIDHVRVEGRRAVILGDLMPVYDGYDQQADSPEGYALAKDIERQIRAVLDGLPKLTREMFVLTRLHGMTHREVADKMGVSKSLVDKYMVQALLRCRDSLGSLDKLD